MRRPSFEAAGLGPTNRRAPVHRVVVLLQVLHCANARDSMVSSSEASQPWPSPNPDCQLDPWCEDSMIPTWQIQAPPESTSVESTWRLVTDNLHEEECRLGEGSDWVRLQWLLWVRYFYAQTSCQKATASPSNIRGQLPSRAPTGRCNDYPHRQSLEKVMEGKSGRAGNSWSGMIANKSVSRGIDARSEVRHAVPFLGWAELGRISEWGNEGRAWKRNMFHGPVNRPMQIRVPSCLVRSAQDVA